MTPYQHQVFLFYTTGQGDLYSNNLHWFVLFVNIFTYICTNYKKNTT